jgi:hypothetical protein
MGDETSSDSSSRLVWGHDTVVAVVRGGCSFSVKALHAAEAGARGIVVVDTAEGAEAIPMGGGAEEGVVDKESRFVAVMVGADVQPNKFLESLVGAASTARAHLAGDEEGTRGTPHGLCYTISSHSAVTDDDGYGKERSVLATKLLMVIGFLLLFLACRCALAVDDGDDDEKFDEGKDGGEEEEEEDDEDDKEEDGEEDEEDEDEDERHRSPPSTSSSEGVESEPSTTVVHRERSSVFLSPPSSSSSFTTGRRRRQRQRRHLCHHKIVSVVLALSLASIGWVRFNTSLRTLSVGPGVTAAGVDRKSWSGGSGAGSSEGGDDGSSSSSNSDYHSGRRRSSSSSSSRGRGAVTLDGSVVVLDHRETDEVVLKFLVERVKEVGLVEGYSLQVRPQEYTLYNFFLFP